MGKMFINYSNHPSAKWSKEQLSAAKRYGNVQDMGFPNIAPEATTNDVVRLARSEAAKLIALEPDAVMCQGEMTLTYHVVSLLKEKGITVLCACTERMKTEVVASDGATVTQSVFVFRGFRAY